MFSRNLRTLGGTATKTIFKRADCCKMAVAARSTGIPGNVQGWYVQEQEDSQKAQSAADRSREVSGQQQTSKMFSSGFMSSQGEKADAAATDKSEGKPYDLDGNAHLESVLLTNVPEPYEPEDASSLKEGLPEGLSDCVRSRGQRWAMEDRLGHYNEHL